MKAPGPSAHARPSARSPTGAAVSARTSRRRAAYTALLGDGDELHLLPHALYVALVTGQSQGAALAGRTMTLLDWHVALDDEGNPIEVVGETTTPLTFDADGRVDWRAPVPAACGVGAATCDGPWTCAPTEAQRAALRDALFGGRWATRDASASGGG